MTCGQTKTINVYKGALYETPIGESILVKQGYPSYFYKSEKAPLEMDFFIP